MLEIIIGILGTILVFFVLACCCVSGRISKLEDSEELDSLLEK